VWSLAFVLGFSNGWWSALAQIESGGNDCAVGYRGEVSRYQILPACGGATLPQRPIEAAWLRPVGCSVVMRIAPSFLRGAFAISDGFGILYLVERSRTGFATEQTSI